MGINDRFSDRDLENFGDRVKTVHSDESIQTVINLIKDARVDNLYEVIVPPGHENETFTAVDHVRVTNTGGPQNVRTVHEGQVIQSVIDSCPVAVGNLKEGYTNPYVINVPPGHEKEYYSLVRTGADVASDKRNVKVIYENNPDGNFTVEKWDDCNEIGDWTAYSGTLALDTSKNFEGTHCLKMEQSASSGYAGIIKPLSEDFSGYQGLLMSVDINTLHGKTVVFHLRDTDGKEGRTEHTLGGRYNGHGRFTIFFPLYSENNVDNPDLTKINRIKIMAGGRVTGYTGPITLYLDDFKLVKTIPHTAALLRFDDAFDDHWDYVVKNLDARGIKGLFAVQGGRSMELDSTNKLTKNHLHAMTTNGHDLINHLVSNVNLLTASKTKTYEEILGGEKFLNYYGNSRSSYMLRTPSQKQNIHSIALARKAGFYDVSPLFFGFPASLAAANDPAFTVTAALNRFLSSKQGGIVQIVIHGVTNETNFCTFLDWVEENFSEIILGSTICEKMPQELKCRRKDIPNGVEKTLSADYSLYCWQGSIFLLDPGGGARDIIPAGDFAPFHQITLVNTADADEALTFDPTFTSAGNHTGAAHITVMTDTGETWVVNQLVGRTISNTPDGGSGTIIANTADTVTAVLEGGTSNDWQTGEAYTIAPVGLNQDVLQNERGQFVGDGLGWLKIFVG